jgi:molybdopterin-guanine dinucleotide biosynthesis protein A
MIPGRSRLTDVTGALLVGGASRRMGIDKVMLKVDGRPMVARMVELLSSVFETLLVVGHHRPEFDELGISVVEDAIPDTGAAGGIYTALHRSLTPHTFVTACDMPNLTDAVIRHILEKRHEADAVIPMGSSGAEPLCAVYARSCELPMHEGVKGRRLRIRENLRDLHVIYPSIRATSGGKDPFLNLNRPEDLANLKKQPV